MSDDRARLKSLRTWILCLVTLVGLLGLGFYAVARGASPLLVVAIGIVCALPLAAWIGGKGWASFSHVLEVMAEGVRAKLGAGGGP